MNSSFRRTVSEELYQNWLEVELASTIQSLDEEDEMIWQCTSSRIYSSQSLYKIINFRGTKHVHISIVWSLKMPPRVHFFSGYLLIIES